VADGFRFVIQSLNQTAKIANNLHDAQSDEKAKQPEIQQRERDLENKKSVTIVEKPVNGSLSQPAVEQEQKTKDGLRKQQKAGRVKMEITDTLHRSEKRVQPAIKKASR
jgi:hypothetical protein